MYIYGSLILGLTYIDVVELDDFASGSLAGGYDLMLVMVFADGNAVACTSRSILYAVLMFAHLRAVICRLIYR